MMKWTPETLDRAVEALARCRVMNQALAIVRGEVGDWVTVDALDAALRRHRGTSAFACLGSRATGSPPPPYEAGPPSKPPVHVVDDEAPETLREFPAAPALPLGWCSGRADVTLFVPDAHWPFADRGAWETMIHCARRLRPRRIVILGDFLDFFQVSSHDKDPSRLTTVESDAAVAREALDQLDGLGAEEKHFLEGNHEKRLQKYIWKSASALMGSVSVPQLLGLDERGWQFTPYHQHKRIDDVYVTHDTGHAGAWAHQRSAADFMGSVVIGHTHRIATMSFGNSLGQRFVAAMFGWLGSVVEADYMPEVKRMKDWSHGFGIGYTVDGHMSLTAVPIVNRSAVLHGEVVSIRG